MGDAGALLVGLLMAASAISVTGKVDLGIAAQPDVFSAYFVPAFIPILLPFAGTRHPAASTSASRSSAGRGAPASRPSPPTANTCTTACSTWATPTCTLS